MLSLHTSILLVVINLFVSYKGFKDSFFLERYQFKIDAILLQKDYKRLITSGFLHVNWMHLLFNVFVLWTFGSSIEAQIGTPQFLLVYFLALIGGNMLALFVHRYDGSYSSVGASGAIMGVIFSAIAITPGMSISIFILPAIPGWLFGLAYVIISIYGIRSRTDNIGHDNHLGGGLAGMLIGIMLYPESLVNNTFTILIITVPAIAFILFIVYKPAALLVDNVFYKQQDLTIEDKYNISKLNKQKELDRLLEKIHKRGIESLSKKEKEALKEYSK